MKVFFLLFLFSCSNSYLSVKSRFIYRDDKFIILDRSLYPGLYKLRGKTVGKIVSTHLLQRCWVNKIRGFIRDRIFINTLEMSDENRNLILSIVLSERLDKSLKYLYKLGIGHFFAASGLHMYILLLMLGRNYFSIIFAFFYLLIIFSPSILRAFIFCFFSFLSNLIGEERNIYKEHLLSLIICISLFGFKSFSLHLSFLASFIIVKEKNSLKATILISICSIVPCLYFIQEANIISFLPNLLLTPFFSVLVIFSFITVFIQIPFLEVYMNFIIYFSKFIQKYSIIQIKLHLPFLFLILYYLLLFLYLYFKYRKK